MKVLLFLQVGGVGTKAYKFIWGMVGENKDYDDQDWLKTSELK